MIPSIVYTRFSSDEQNENSTETQLHTVREWAERNGYAVVAHYKDEAETGRDDNRLNFLKMFRDVKSGAVKAQALLVYKMSRFFRNVEYASAYESRLERMGVKLISVTEPMPENEALAKLSKNIVRVFDEFLIDNIGMLSRDGTKQIVRKGYWSGGMAPNGYRNEHILDREGEQNRRGVVTRGTLVKDERLAGLIARAFQIAAETGKGGSLIYKQLVAESGGPVLGNNGKPLGGGGINTILRNPIYKGVFVYNKFCYRTEKNGLAIDGAKPIKHRLRKPEKDWVSAYNPDWRIVSDEVWDAAQKARAANQRESFGHGCKRASFLLTGMVVCGTCGNSCGGKWQRSRNATFSENSNYFYYRCRGAMNGSDVCTNKSKIRGKALEDAVINRLLAEILDDDFVRDVAKEIISMHEQASEADKDAALAARRQALIEEQTRLVELAAKAGGSIPIIADKIKELEQERIRIDAAISAVPAVKLDLERLMPVVRTKLNDWRSLVRDTVGMDDLRSVLKKFIEGIRIDPDGHVYIKWREAAVYEILKIEPPVSEIGLGGTRKLDSGHSPTCLREWRLLTIPAPERRSLPTSGGDGPPQIVNLLLPADESSGSEERRAA